MKSILRPGSYRATTSFCAKHNKRNPRAVVVSSSATRETRNPTLGVVPVRQALHGFPLAASWRPCQLSSLCASSVQLLSQT